MTHAEVTRGRLDWHHEPPFQKIRAAPTRVRVPGLAVRIRVPGRQLQRVLAVAVLAMGLGVTAATAAGLVQVSHARYLLAAETKPVRPVPAPHGPWAAVPSALEPSVVGPSVVGPSVVGAGAARSLGAAPSRAGVPQVPPPVFLTIPAIGVRTRLTRLGLTRSGALQPPDSTAVAGWYTGSPPPGATGAAVIGGHVDSYVGPGVFFRLHLLRPGDRIYVRQANGKTAVFRVTSVGRYLKDRFPTSNVYGPVPTPELRLITCGGTFDHARGSYLSNVVVYATMTTG